MRAQNILHWHGSRSLAKSLTATAIAWRDHPCHQLIALAGDALKWIGVVPGTDWRVQTALWTNDTRMHFRQRESKLHQFVSAPGSVPTPFMGPTGRPMFGAIFQSQSLIDFTSQATRDFRQARAWVRCLPPLPGVRDEHSMAGGAPFRC
jgi:hypothetical protein